MTCRECGCPLASDRPRGSRCAQCERGERTTKITMDDPKDARRESEREAHDAIISALSRRGPLTTMEVASEVETEQQATAHRLTRMQSYGLVDNNHARWRLTDRGAKRAKRAA